jgi:REP element-mobilizing transposase RayT
VADRWQKIAQIRPNVTLDAWIVMPNHLHGIIMITNPPPVQTSHWDVSPPATKSRLRSNSLGAIVCQFKSACTKQIWADGFAEFGWQMRYHDSIIRNEESGDRIRAYILNNPAKWGLDKHHPLNNP